MKRPTPRRGGLQWRRLRLWALPTLAAIVFVSVYEPGFESNAMRTALAKGDPDSALGLLETATSRHVLPELTGVFWWPAEARERRIELLHDDLPRSSEDLSMPTIVAPRGKHRVAPVQIRLAQPAPRPLQLQLHHRELGLKAVSVPWPAGRRSIEIDVDLLAGSTYDIVLSEPDEGAMVCLTQFTILSQPEAFDVGILMQTAWDMAPDDGSGELLASLVAMHYGLYAEVYERLAELADRPGYEQLVRELQAITLARTDLDHSAVALLEG